MNHQPHITIGHIGWSPDFQKDLQPIKWKQELPASAVKPMKVIMEAEDEIDTLKEELVESKIERDGFRAEAARLRGELRLALEQLTEERNRSSKLADAVQSAINHWNTTPQRNFPGPTGAYIVSHLGGALEKWKKKSL